MTDHYTAAVGILKALNAEIIKRGGDPSSLKAYDAASYARGIDDAARAYWKEGVAGNFVTRMKQVTKFGLRDAFDQGASDVDVGPEDYTKEDTDFRDGIINDEQSHINDLLDYLDGLANDPNAKLDDANVRLDLWKQRYSDVVNRAKVRFGGKERLIWRLGQTEEHCDTCLKLNGIVAWAQEWDKSGVHPQQPPNDNLECGGWRCDCRLESAPNRRTPKAFDKIMAAIANHG